MRAFVTGGTGFVGSHLVALLQAEGHDVVSLVRDATKARAVFGSTPPTIVEGDLRARDAIAHGLQGCDVVFHLAGLTAARSVDELFDVNERATAALAAAAASATVHRFVYVSSLSAAGPSSPGHPRTEADPPAAVSNYGRSKLAGEQAVQRTRVPWTILRAPAVYGPRDAEILRIFKFLRWHVAPLVVPRAQELSFIHAEDLARALVALAADRGTERLYYATHPEVVTAEEFVRAVHRAMHPSTTREPVVVPLPGWIARVAVGATYGGAKLVGRTTVLSPDKLREFRQEAWTCTSAALEHDTGWNATMGLDDGLRQTVAWYREHGWL